MPNNLDTLSNVTGLPKEQVSSIWDQVQANLKQLRSCKRHTFLIPKGRIGLNDDLHCGKCGGTMRHVSVRTYVDGYIAAGGDPEDVWPGWE